MVRKEYVKPSGRMLEKHLTLLIKLQNQKRLKLWPRHRCLLSVFDIYRQGKAGKI